MSQPNHRTSHDQIICGLVLVVSGLILARGTPTLAAYARTFRTSHGLSAVVVLGLALPAVFGLLFLGILKWPRSTSLALGLAAVLLVILSGNVVALTVASCLFGITLLAGDLVGRLWRRREPDSGDLSSSFAAGVVCLGVLTLLLGEIGLAKPVVLVTGAALLVVARRRRIPALVRLLCGSVRPPGGEMPSVLHALWLAVVTMVLASGFLGALRPDVSWDGLAYHLPAIRDFAAGGRAEPLSGLYPQSFLWRNHETYLSLGFLFGGERVVRFLHLAVGVGTFAAALALASRVGRYGASPLVLLALAAFPAACLQLKETYVELPAAFLVTAAAAEIAASGREPHRARLGAFLFGGAIATKIFSLFAGAGLAILLARRGGLRWRRILPLAACALIPLLPWLAWSQSRAGFFLAPYSDPLLSGRTNPPAQTYILPGPRPTSALPEVGGFLRLPYDLTFHASRFWTSGDGYTGLLPLLLLIGVVGLGRTRFGLFCVAALSFLIPWHVLSSLHLLYPSVRFLIPVYPLYAVFAAEGLDWLTEGFRGGLGRVAGVSLAVLSLGFPAQLFSVPFDTKVAVGRISREQALAAYLPPYPLWKHVRRQDRVILLGDWDRYHCPAAYVFWDHYLPAVWGEDPKRWCEEMRRLRITHILYRSDYRDRTALLASLKDSLRFVASRGTGTLYRFDWQRTACAGLRRTAPVSARATDGR